MNAILYIKATVVVSVRVGNAWAMLGRFFHSLPVPCGASPDVTSLALDVTDSTDSREKRNQGQSEFLRQKIW